MKKNRITLYDTFRTTSNNEKDALNDIIKGTKSVLVNEKGYESYIRKYLSSTKISTFKSPEITEYPVLKTDSSFLIPINTVKFKQTGKNKIFKMPNLLLGTELFQKNQNDLLEDFNRRLTRLVKYNEERKNNRSYFYKTITETKERYNSLFLDFFNKWKSPKKKIDLRYALSQGKTSEVKTTKENPFINFNIKERYAGLYYDENEIFNTNYDKFILSKLAFVKKNKIKNFTSEIKSSFHDSNDKIIKLKLESIKLTFFPKNKEQNNYNEFYVFIPLSFVFLFYSYDFSFFQKILMSLFKFNNNYKTINFKDEGFIDLLNKLHIGEQEENKDKEEDILSNYNKGNINSPEKNSVFRKSYSKQINYVNKLRRKSSHIFDKKVTKTKIVHSNKKFQITTISNEQNNQKNEENQIIYSNNNKNNILYNEYYFLWETSAVTYDVKMEMPKIYFYYQNFKYNIIAFCEKNLFLYLYKNNFINWDFYALNFLFSFKYFRTIILNFFSLNKNTTLYETSIFKDINNKIYPSIRKNYKLNLDEEENKSENGLGENKDIVISSKKILNQMSENNESYMFFYTDQNCHNHIINLYSYKIKIEHMKLNPKLNWEFILNFKQMKFLNEVSQYENLLTFLPKIITTNYEIGDLDINFDVFYNNFDAKILQNEAGHNSTIKKHLKIEVFKPHIESEIIGSVRDDKKIEKELSDNLLQKLNKIKMTNWSRKILSIMKKDLFFKSYRASEIYTNKFNFLKKSPQKEDIIGRLITHKSNKKKMTYFGGYKNKKIEI